MKKQIGKVLSILLTLCMLLSCISGLAEVFEGVPMIELPLEEILQEETEIPEDPEEAPEQIEEPAEGSAEVEEIAEEPEAEEEDEFVPAPIVKVKTKATDVAGTYTSVNTFVNGGEYVIARKGGSNWYLLTSENGAVAAKTLSHNGTITAVPDNTIWKASTSGSGFHLYNEATGCYLEYDGVNTNVSIAVNSTLQNPELYWEIDGDVDKVKISTMCSDKRRGIVYNDKYTNKSNFSVTSRWIDSGVEAIYLFKKGAAEPTVTVTAEGGKTSVKVGSTLKLTAEYSNFDTDPTSIEWTCPANVEAVKNGKELTITGKTVGDAVIYATAGGVKSNGITIAVTQPKSLESVPEFEDGEKYVIAYNNSGNWALLISDGTSVSRAEVADIAEAPDTALWTAEAAATGFYLKDSTGKYIQWSSNSKAFSLQTSTTCYWTCSGSKDAVKLTESNSSNPLRYSASGNKFEVSSTATANTMSLYQLASTTPHITVSGDTHDLVVGGEPGEDKVELTATLKNLDGKAVTWTSSDLSVATVSGTANNATVTGLMSGTVTITAAAGEVSDTFEITVTKINKVTGTFNPATSFVAGGQYLIAVKGSSNWYLLSSENGKVTHYTLDHNSTITEVPATTVWTTQTHGDGFDLFNTETARYLEYGGSNSNPSAVVNTTLKQTNLFWICEADTEGVKISTEITDGKAKRGIVWYDQYTSKDTFGCSSRWKDADYKAIYLFKLQTAEPAISVSPATASLVTNDEDTAKKTVVLTANPENVEGSVTWSVTEGAEFVRVTPDTADRKKATVTALKAGTATVTAAVGSVSATATVTVTSIPEKVTVTSDQNTLVVGGTDAAKTAELTAVLEGLPGQTVKWTVTAGGDKVDLTENGNKAIVVAKAGATDGTVTVKATCGTVEATVDLTVKALTFTAYTKVSEPSVGGEYILVGDGKILSSEYLTRRVSGQDKKYSIAEELYENASGAIAFTADLGDITWKAEDGSKEDTWKFTQGEGALYISPNSDDGSVRYDEGDVNDITIDGGKLSVGTSTKRYAWLDTTNGCFSAYASSTSHVPAVFTFYQVKAAPAAVPEIKLTAEKTGLVVGGTADEQKAEITATIKNVPDTATVTWAVTAGSDKVTYMTDGNKITVTAKAGATAGTVTVKASYSGAEDVTCDLAVKVLVWHTYPTAETLEVGGKYIIVTGGKAISSANVNEQGAGKIDNFCIAEKVYTQGDAIAFDVDAETLTWTVSAGSASDTVALSNGETKLYMSSSNSGSVRTQDTGTDITCSDHKLSNGNAYAYLYNNSHFEMTTTAGNAATFMFYCVESQPQPTTCKVTLGTVANGTVTLDPATAATGVNAGTNVTLTITPDTGYELDKLTDNGTEKTVTGNTYTISSIGADHTVNVTFKQKAAEPGTAEGTIKSATTFEAGKTYVFGRNKTDGNSSTNWLILSTNVDEAYDTGKTGDFTNLTALPENALWKAETNGNGFALYNEANKVYLGVDTEGNLTTNTSKGSAYWTVASGTQVTYSAYTGTLYYSGSFNKFKVRSGSTNGSLSMFEFTGTSEPVETKSVTITADRTEIETNGTKTATLEATLQNVEDPVTWTVTKGSDCVTIDADPTEANNTKKRVVTAVKAGDVTITATAGGVSGTIDLTVKTVDPEIVIDASRTELVLGEAGENAATLTATLKGMTETAVTWTATLDEGKAVVSLSASEGSSITVTAANPGTTTITAAAGNVTKTCTITVKTAPKYSEVKEIANDGVYVIAQKSGSQWYLLDVAGGKVKMTAVSEIDNIPESALWTAAANGTTGGYTLKHNATGKYLDYHNSTTAGETIQLNTTPAEANRYWITQAAGDGINIVNKPDVEKARGLIYNDTEGGTTAANAWTITSRGAQSGHPVYLFKVTSSAEPEGKTWTVTVNEPVGGTAVLSATTAKEGTDVTLTVAAAEGYALESVKDGETDVTESLQGNIYTIGKIAADHTLTVTFKEIAPETFAVNFVLDGAAYGEAQEVESGKTVTMPEKPADVKETGANNEFAWTFDAWYADAEFRTPFDETAPITAATTVYGRYKFDTFMGDMNMDGRVRSVDASMILMSQAETYTFDKYQEQLADLTGDGKVSGTDASYILQIAVKIIEEEIPVTFYK